MPLAPPQGSLGQPRGYAPQGAARGPWPAQGNPGVAPPTISYASPQSWTEATAISTLSPTTTGATSFAVTTGALPTGLSLNAGTGAITGTPTTPGTGSFKVTATGDGGSTESAAVSWTVADFLLQFSPAIYLDLERSSKWQDSGRTTPVTADADPIGALDDLSGNARHVIQATAGKRPTYKTAIQNGKPVARFDATDDILGNAGFAALDGLSAGVLLIVWKAPGSGADNSIGFGPSIGALQIQNTAGTTYSYFSIGNYGTYAESFNAWRLNTIRFDGGGSGNAGRLRVYANGVEKSLTYNGTVGTAFSTQASLGVGPGLNIGDITPPAGIALNGDLAFIAVIPSTLSDGNLAAIEAWINSRWAIY